MALFSDNADFIFDFLSSPCLQSAASPASVPPPVQQQQVKVDPQLMFNTTPAGRATFPFGSDLHPFFALHPSAMLMNEFAIPFNMGLDQLQAAQQQLMIAARQVQQQQLQLQQQHQDLFGFLDASSSMTLAEISPQSSQLAETSPRILSTLSTPPISPQTIRHSPSLSPTPESHVSHGNSHHSQDFLLQQHGHQQLDDKPLAPKVHTCINCQTSVTPMWRRDMEGNRVCNACGVYFRMNGVHRVVKVGGTAVQRRRTRVKDPNAPPKKRKRSSNAATTAVSTSAAAEVPSKRRKRVDSENEEESDTEFA
ncbi:UNVERIFIED_CONTAM: putative electron transfer flavoprotein subunit [Siphonaria sp. JEL0065]|nr:putative electron transfer flavoprotein subunit [Siphonaria sp. JEL0065]